jgi:hypothetical protein
MRLYILIGKDSQLPIAYRRTALSATDAIRKRSAMLANICQEVLVEDRTGCQVDWLTLGQLSMQESAGR